MKRFIYLLLILAAGCGSDSEQVLPRDPSASARTQSCTNAITYGAFLTSPYTTVTPNIYWRIPTLITAYSGPYVDNVAATVWVTVENSGTATFRYSMKGGAVWNTLAPGATHTFSKGILACGGYVIATMDIERLSCGSMTPKVWASSASAPHSVNTTWSNMVLGTWTAPACPL
jgi:hypothetical protein